MSAGCEWNISPSYDLTYAINRGAGSEHQLSINNAPASWATYKELSKIAETFGIRDHKEIIGNTLEANTLCCVNYLANTISQICGLMKL